jgi:GNAT superfamily N-acetyltransferase
VSTRIEEIDTRTAPEGTLVALHELHVLERLEQRPDDQPEPLALDLAEMRGILSNRLLPIWAMYDGDEIVAEAGAHMETDQDLDNGFVWVFVHPEHRGRGFARALLDPAISRLEELDRTKTIAESASHLTGGGLAEAAGLSKVMLAKRSRLNLADLDLDLMDQWIDRAAERTGDDYELVFAESPIPDDMLDTFVEALHIMNTAPLEDLEEEPHVWTAEEWREREQLAAKRDDRILNLMALHRPSGKFAGFTNIKYQGLFPEQAWQWDTGVDPTHRNLGLGRWLKATMIRRLLTDFPEVKRIDTFNAGSNEPMLNINIAMGFGPVLFEQVYQGPTEAVRSWLDRGSQG